MTTETPREKAAERRILPLKAIVLFAIAALATVAFVWIANYMVEGAADAFDNRWSLAVHSIDTPLLDHVFFAFTTIGSGPCLWGSVTLVGLLALRRGRWQLAVLLAGNALLAWGVNIALKHSFGRERPMLFEEITRPSTWSFPSGHSMSAVQIWGAIAAVLIALYPARRIVIVPCAVLLIGSIGLSRVYLGVHWPTDVLAGFAAGVPFLSVSIHLIHRIMRVTRPQ
jgi:membrane-associated phospholipid phosphatase